MNKLFDVSFAKTPVESHPRFSHNERGMVLILAIGFLAIMSLLGATLMTLSTSEIHLSSNYRDNREAFSAADRAIEYAVTGAAITSGGVDLYNDNNSSGVAHLSFIEDPAFGPSGLDPSADNSVVFLGAGTPPIGSGSDINKFQALNYAISATGIFPNTVAHPRPSRSAIRAQVAKIVPK